MYLENMISRERVAPLPSSQTKNLIPFKLHAQTHDFKPKVQQSPKSTLKSNVFTINNNCNNQQHQKIQYTNTLQTRVNRLQQLMSQFSHKIQKSKSKYQQNEKKLSKLSQQQQFVLTEEIINGLMNKIEKNNETYFQMIRENKQSIEQMRNNFIKKEQFQKILNLRDNYFQCKIIEFKSKCSGFMCTVDKKTQDLKEQVERKFRSSLVCCNKLIESYLNQIKSSPCLKEQNLAGKLYFSQALKVKAKTSQAKSNSYKSTEEDSLTSVDLPTVESCSSQQDECLEKKLKNIIENKQIIFNNKLYYVDHEGNLMDQQGAYLTNKQGKNITINNEQQEKLKLSNMLV